MSTIPVFTPFLEGVLASLQGAEASFASATIREQYVKFATNFAIITVVSYFLLSASMVLVIPATCLILLGPILGPLVFLGLAYMSCVVGVILWYFDKFPSWIFMGSYGVLRPFVSIPQLSFLIMNFIFTHKTDFFLMEGTRALANHYLRSSNVSIQERGKDLLQAYNSMQKEYKKPSLISKLTLSLYNMVVSVSLKTFVFVVLLGQSPRLYIVDPSIDAFTTGIQLVAIYTIRVKSMSFMEHTMWCIQNVARIVGFMFPAMLIENSVGWAATFLSLGLGYAATASLVEDLIIEKEGKIKDK